MSCIHNFYGTCNLDNSECKPPSTNCPKYHSVTSDCYYRCLHLTESCTCKLSGNQCLTDSPECTDYHAYPYKKKNSEPIKYCKYCFNARVYKPTDEELLNPFATELTDENDSSSCGVGHCFSRNRRFMINSGHGQPVNIEFEEWTEKMSEWHRVGIYYPKYCPECGRRLDEYEKTSNYD